MPKYRIMIMVSEREVINDSTFKYLLDENGDIKEFDTLTDLDKAVKKCLEKYSKSQIVPMQFIDFEVDTDIDAQVAPTI